MNRFRTADRGKRRFAHDFAGLLQVILLTGLMACQLSCKNAPPQPKSALPPNPFKGIAFRSLDDLGRAALTAISDNNPQALDVLRVADYEYRDVIWARIPQTELANMDVETAWSWVDRDSQKAQSRVLSDYGGEPLKFKKTYVNKETRTYPAVRIIYGVIITVEDSRGKEHNIKLMNVVAEIDGYYRVIAFDV